MEGADLGQRNEMKAAAINLLMGLVLTVVIGGGWLLIARSLDVDVMIRLGVWMGGSLGTCLILLLLCWWAQDRG